MTYSIDQLNELNKKELKPVAEEFGITRRFVHNEKRDIVVAEILSRQAAHEEAADLSDAIDITDDAELEGELDAEWFENAAPTHPGQDLLEAVEAAREQAPAVSAVTGKALKPREQPAPALKAEPRARSAKRDPAVYTVVNMAFTKLRKTHKKPNKLWGTMNIGKREGYLDGYAEMMRNYGKEDFRGAAITEAGAGNEKYVHVIAIKGQIDSLVDEVRAELLAAGAQAVLVDVDHDGGFAQLTIDSVAN